MLNKKQRVEWIIFFPYYKCGRKITELIHALVNFIKDILSIILAKLPPVFLCNYPLLKKSTDLNIIYRIMTDIFSD